MLLLFRFRATHTRKSPEFTKYFQFDLDALDLDALDALDLDALDLDALCSVKDIKYYLMDFVCKGGVWGDVCEKTPEQIKALKTWCAGNQHNS